MKKLGIVIMTGMALAVLFNATLTEAGTPVTAKLNYQGRLTDSNGVPIADGNYNMIFQIYDADVAGASVWGPETHTGVAVEDGLFSVNLGGGTPTPVTLSGIDFNKDCWLQTTVGATTYTPRQLLTAVTYALFALSAPSGSIDHGALTGLGDDDHTQYFALSQSETVTGIPAFNGGTSGSSSPFTVDSDQKVVNLNADHLDNFSEEYFFKLADSETVTGIPAFNGGTTGSSAPFTADSTFLVTNLNADLLDGQHGSYYMAGTTDLWVNTTGDTMTGQLTNTYNTGSPFVITSTTVNTNLNADLHDGYHAGNASGNVPVSNGTVNTNLNADLLDGYNSPQLGNFGQWQPHSTFIDCNTNPTYWGWNYVQGATNCPNATSSQWYRGNFSLGSEYPMRGAGGYSLELAIPRYSPGTAGVWMRTVEGGTIGGWTRIDGNDYTTYDGRYVNVTGDTMTGELIAPAFRAPATGYTSGAPVDIGDVAVDYPANAGWPATYNATLLLSGLNNTSIGFHDSGQSVGTLRYTNNNFYLGEATSWGVSNLTVGGNINLTSGELQANKVCRWGTNVKVIDATYGDTDTCPAGYCAITMVNTSNTNVYPEGAAGGRGSYPQHSGDAKLLCCRCQL